MNGPVAAVAGQIPDACCATRSALNDLRSKTIRLRGQRKKAVLIKCGDLLTKALGQ